MNVGDVIRVLTDDGARWCLVLHPSGLLRVLGSLRLAQLNAKNATGANTARLR